MSRPLSVMMRLGSLWCEGCIHLPQRLEDPMLIVRGKVPCFECEAMVYTTGYRTHKILMEPQPAQPGGAKIQVPLAPPAQTM